MGFRSLVRVLVAKLYYSGSITLYHTNHLGNLKPPEPTFTREYRIGAKSRQKLIDAALYGYDTKVNEVLAFVLTYSRRLTSEQIEKECNKHVKRFFDLGTRERSKFNGYLWTKERCKDDMPHYHVLVDAKRFQKNSIKWLNDLWCSCRGDYSGGAIRSKGGLKVRSMYGAATYAAKYSAKGKDGNNKPYIFKSRSYAIANKWMPPKPIDIIEPDQIAELENNLIPLNRSVDRNSYRHFSEYATMCRVDADYSKQIFKSL